MCITPLKAMLLHSSKLVGFNSLAVTQNRWLAELRVSIYLFLEDESLQTSFSTFKSA